jgi:O-antigen/teichoic acid export membrane protein
MHPYRPRIAFDGKKAMELFRFGKHLLGSSIIILLITQGDDAVVGKLLGVTALGFYVMAYKFSNMPATGITHVFAQVAFPTYAKLQDDLEGLRNAYLKALKYIACISIPASGGLIVLAPEVVKCFLGERWMEIVPAMRILCIFGIIRALGGTTGPLFQGVGRPDIITKLNLGKLVIISVLIVPLTRRLGIVGTSLAVTIPMIIEQGFSWHICARIIQGKVRQIFFMVAPSFVGTLFMMGFLGLFKTFGFYKGDAISVLCLIALGGFLYFLFFCLFYQKHTIEIIGFLFPSAKDKTVIT